MESAPVPVTMGSARAWTRVVDGLEVTEARFSAGAVLDRHIHERPIVCVMLEGSFEHVGDRRTHDCTPGTVVIEPAGDPHGNRIRRGGARVLVVEPEPRDELMRSLGGALERGAYFRNPGIVARARSLTRELAARDAAAPLALEAGALELLAIAARLEVHARGAEPAWLRRAREMVEDRFREPLQLTDLAREAGVHPAHLSRVFRQRYRESIAARVRRLRTEWAAERLVESDDPISAIALAAGFADQSHLTRALRARTGMTPARYRRERSR
jgi:AraC family transcriptional regulator